MCVTFYDKYVTDVVNAVLINSQSVSVMIVIVNMVKLSFLTITSFVFDIYLLNTMED
jgi:hypothetical protein